MRPFIRGSLLKAMLLPPVLVLFQFRQCCLWGGRGAALCGSSGAGRDRCPDLRSESMVPPQHRAAVIVHFHSSLGPWHGHCAPTPFLSPSYSDPSHPVSQPLISPSLPHSVPHGFPQSLIHSLTHSLTHSQCKPTPLLTPPSLLRAGSLIGAQSKFIMESIRTNINL